MPLGRRLVRADASPPARGTPGAWVVLEAPRLSREPPSVVYTEPSLYTSVQTLVYTATHE